MDSIKLNPSQIDHIKEEKKHLEEVLANLRKQYLVLCEKELSLDYSKYALREQQVNNRVMISFQKDVYKDNIKKIQSAIETSDYMIKQKYPSFTLCKIVEAPAIAMTEYTIKDIFKKNG